MTVWEEMVGGGDGCRMEQTGLKNHGGRKLVEEVAIYITVEGQ